MSAGPAALERYPATLDWLLEPANPSVRFFTLRDLLGEPSSSPRLREAREAIMARGPVPRILSSQTKDGCWGRAEDFYARAKYKGTVWNLILLATLGADGRDPRVRRACEFVFEYSQDRAGGGFSYLGTARNGGTPSGVIPCLTGNMLWCLIRFGRLGDPRVRRGLDWITRYLRFDDGETQPPARPPYSRYEMCWGRHTCLDAVVKPLKALAEIPPERRTRAMARVLVRAREFLLLHRLYQRSHAPGRPAKLKWLKLAFPLMWDTDALEMLDLLAGLGCRDPRLRDAEELLLSKRDARGRWPLEETYARRYLVGFGRKGAPSKWVTLRALTCLRKLRGKTGRSGG
jgi:hypothetical protein